MYYYIIIGILSLINVYLYHKASYIRSLVEMKIISKENGGFFAKYTDLFYMFECIFIGINTLISLFNLIIHAGTFNILWSIFILFVYFVPLLISDYKIKSKSTLVKYASKYTKTPQSVIEFKLDSYRLVNEKPDYLLDARYLKELSQNKMMQFMAVFDTKGSSKYFHLFNLYKEILAIMNSKSLEVDYPLINSYILENIAELSTVTSILKDEKLVNALQTDLGKEETEKLTLSLTKIRNEIKKLVLFIKKEKLTSTKSSETLEVIGSLDTIRSMQKFKDFIK